MSESLSLEFKFPKRKTETSIAGVGSINTAAQDCVSAVIKSRNSNFRTQLDFHVLPKIMQLFPNTRVNTSDWKLPQSVTLADPLFNRPQRIDILIGAEIFFDLLCVGQFRLKNSSIVLQKTVFDWIICDSLANSPSVNVETHCCLTIVSDIDKQLQSFWSIEEVNDYRNSENPFTGEDAVCKNHFMHNITRNQEGRFIVTLPMRLNIIMLGNSRDAAIKRFYQLEKQLGRNEALKEQYIEFMEEYKGLGHGSN
ncbi:uncharacterized protein LOC142329212 [Lycorma delicatula]|uniref:uncharacterized protein LOC142329212 n=1 Tax=Lycorma delicatula TaxID=130591 RepID=UPI003F51235A